MNPLKRKNNYYKNNMNQWLNKMLKSDISSKITKNLKANQKPIKTYLKNLNSKQINQIIIWNAY